MNRKVFLEGTDVMKSAIFVVNRTYWKPIENKVVAWVKEGWWTWEEEKPDWFTDQWKSIVPEKMKPTKKAGDVDSGRDSRDKIAAENEGDEASTVGEGDEQKGQRRSIVEIISGQKAVSSKVMPAGGEIKKEIDEEEFVREIKRRGSMTM